MTERDRNELTNQPNSLNLEGRGNIMPDGTNGSPEQNQPPEAQAGDSYTNPFEGIRPPAGASEAEGDAHVQRKFEEINEPRRRAQRARYETIEDPLQRAKIDKLVQDTFAGIDGNDALLLEARDQMAQYEHSRQKLSESERKVGVPENLDELAKLIIKMSSPEWGIGGDKALIDIVKDENGQDYERVNTIRFLEWYRANMIRIHNSDPLTPVNYFGDPRMGVRNDQWGSMISFGEVIYQDSLFLEKKEDSDGKEIRVSNPDYKLLREQMLMEVFLFSTVRNADIEYTRGRGDNKQMMEAITNAFITNPLTRSNFFEFIMTMPSMSRASAIDGIAGEHEKIHAKREANFYMGDAVRLALSSYINIFDHDQLTRILGEEAQLFTLKYDEYSPDGHLIKTKGKEIEFDPEEVKHQPDPDKRKHTRKDEWFNEDGSLKLYAVEVSGKNKGMYKKDSNGKYTEDKNGKPHPKYLDYINVFLSPNPDPKQQTEIRERIALSIMDKTGISYDEAKLAEVWAFSMTHTNGIAARNDTQSVAFDWWTRLTNFKDYRKRQKAEKRGAKYGGNYNMEGLNRIGLNFFEAARDTSGTTIQEIVQGGQGENVGIGKKLIKQMDVEYEKNENGIIFYKDGEEVEGLQASRFDYEKVLDPESNKEVVKTVYFDAAGQKIDTKALGVTTKLKFNRSKDSQQVTFKADLQKQFLPNHMYTAATVYEHIIKEVQMNFPDMVTGYDTHGNPLLDKEKMLKVKDGIEHAIRYSLSTWPEINYDSEFIMWERKERRDEATGRLIAKKRGLNKEIQYLDKNWYIEGTQVRDEPETYLISKKSTILESMFGVDALKFIQFEIEKRGLNEGKKIKEIEGIGFSGEQEKVSVDLSKADGEEFKLAVWRGVFDYMVSSEIAAHRDRGSGFEWYDTEKMIKATLALKEGEFITPDQIKNIQKETGTTWKNLVGKDLAYIFAQAGMEGLWKILALMFKDVMSDVVK